MAARNLDRRVTGDGWRAPRTPGATDPLVRQAGCGFRPEDGQVGFLAEDVEKARQVPGVGNLRFVGDVDQLAQGRVALAFGQAGVERHVPEQDRQQDAMPEPGDRVVIASLAAGGLESVASGLVGNGFENIAEGAAGGMIVEGTPGVKRFGSVKLPDGPPVTNGGSLQRQGYLSQGLGVKIRKTGKVGRAGSGNSGSTWGKLCQP